MSNVGSNISAIVTVTLGVFNLDNSQFSPISIFFYLIGIALVAFLIGLIGDVVEDKLWEWLHKVKGKNQWHGTGQ